MQTFIGIILIAGAALFFATELQGGTRVEKESWAKYPYSNEVGMAAAYYNVDPDLVAAIVSWEQRSSEAWDPNASNPSDPSYGLGQVTPYIAKRFGIIADDSQFDRLYDPQTNLNAVAAFLDYLLNQAGYSLSKSIQCYNEGEPNYNDGHRVNDYENGVMDYYRTFKEQTQ